MQAELLKEFTKAFNSIPFNQLLGMELKELSAEQITMSFVMKKELVGNYVHGILHGGVISSVLDMAGGVAVMMAAVLKNQNKSLEQIAAVLAKAGTISLHIDFIKPGKGEEFIAKAYLVQSGNKISFARMELFNQENTLIASGTGTYLIAN